MACGASSRARAHRDMWVYGRCTYVTLYTRNGNTKARWRQSPASGWEGARATHSPSLSRIHTERLVHYDSCIYIRSKNIPTLCRRAPPGISSENNILMYVGVLPLALSPSAKIPFSSLSRPLPLLPPRSLATSRALYSPAFLMFLYERAFVAGIARASERRCVFAL